MILDDGLSAQLVSLRMVPPAFRRYYCDLQLWPFHKAKMELEKNGEYKELDMKDRVKTFEDLGAKEGSKIKVLCEELHQSGDIPGSTTVYSGPAYQPKERDQETERIKQLQRQRMADREKMYDSAKVNPNLPNDNYYDDDADLQAAIRASLRDVGGEEAMPPFTQDLGQKRNRREGLNPDLLNQRIEEEFFSRDGAMGDTGAAVDLERGEGEEKKTDSTDISHRNNSSAGSLAELSNVAIPMPAAREASLGGSGSKMQVEQRLEQLRDSTKEKYRDWKQRAEHNILLSRIQLKTAEFNDIRENLEKVSKA